MRVKVFRPSPARDCLKIGLERFGIEVERQFVTVRHYPRAYLNFFCAALNDNLSRVSVLTIMNSDKTNRSITLRPVVPEDEPFLAKVYAGTREEEVAGLDDLQKGIFLNLQYKLQKADYERKFPQGKHDIILLDGVAIGRMWVDRTNPDELRGVDIAILPEYRNSGVGFTLIQELLDEASAANKPFRINVTKGNRAIRLYERMGFVKTGETPPIHIAMEWRRPK